MVRFSRQTALTAQIWGDLTSTLWKSTQFRRSTSYEARLIPMLKTIRKPGVLAALFVCWVVVPLSRPVVAQPVGGVVDVQYQIKARMLHPLGAMVRSSKSASKNRNTFIIGILGADPFDAGAGVNHLDRMVAAKKQLSGKRLLVKRFDSAKDLAECDLLFISRFNAEGSKEKSAAARLKAVLPLLKDSPVLLVTDTDGLAAQGAILNFYLTEVAGNVKKVRIEFNPDAAKRHIFDQIEPSVLRVFRLVREK